MSPEAQKYLYDIQQAIELLSEFLDGKTFVDYEREPMLRAAVERKCEVIGEALAQLARAEPAVAAQVTQYQQIIGFRNVLIHAYAEVNNVFVWDIVQKDIPLLRIEVSALLPDESAHG